MIKNLQDVLMQQVYASLQRIQPNNEYFLATVNGLGTIKLQDHNWELVYLTHGTRILSELPEPIIVSLGSLTTAICSATTGLELYQAMIDQSKKLPGWWSLFNPLRSLNIHLKAWIAQTQRDELITADYSQFKRIIIVVEERIKALLATINDLEFKLSKTAEGNNTLNACLQSDYDRVLRQYNALLEDYRRLQLRERINPDPQEARDSRVLRAIITDLNTRLRYANQEVAAAHTRIAMFERRHGEFQYDAENPTVAEVDDLPEFIARHNRGYRGMFRNRADAPRENREENNTPAPR